MKALHLTTPLMHGAEVVDAQKLLHSNKYGTFYNGKEDGEYGVLTAQAAFKAKYHIGYKLSACDHVFGDLLRLYLNGTKPLTLAMRLRRKARSKPPKRSMQNVAFNEAIKWVGTKENPPGSNDNPFGHWYGENGVPWCAEFVSYCYAKAGSKFHYAYVPYIVADARAGRNNLTALHSSEVAHGDVVCFDWNGDGVADHVGIFDKWVTPGSVFETIEGNTSPDSGGDQSNGGEVCRKTRYVSNVEQFVRVHK